MAWIDDVERHQKGTYFRPEEGLAALTDGIDRAFLFRN